MLDSPLQSAYKPNVVLYRKQGEKINQKRIQGHKQLIDNVQVCRRIGETLSSSHSAPFCTIFFTNPRLNLPEGPHTPNPILKKERKSTGTKPVKEFAKKISY